jgi:hypothetical protein
LGIFVYAGRYYLVDSGYALGPGYMPPYPQKRFRAKDFKNLGPQDAEELFNRHHAGLRSVIERSFGVAKSKWRMLKSIPHYPGTKQTQIILVLFALHNYVRGLEGKHRAGRRRQAPDLGPLSKVTAMALSDPNDMEQVRDWITYGLGLLGKTGK